MKIISIVVGLTVAPSVGLEIRSSYMAQAGPQVNARTLKSTMLDRLVAKRQFGGEIGCDNKLQDFSDSFGQAFTDFRIALADPTVANNAELKPSLDDVQAACRSGHQRTLSHHAKVISNFEGCDCSGECGFARKLDIRPSELNKVAPRFQARMTKFMLADLLASKSQDSNEKIASVNTVKEDETLTKNIEVKSNLVDLQAMLDDINQRVSGGTAMKEGCLLTVPKLVVIIRAVENLDDAATDLYVIVPDSISV
ncbi:hypothetical protein BGX33_001834 [Mortierella sp. NVP41]|nr:hypothetical protein BGX33_001834 [Mortierella sp. NVP41]